MVKARLYKGPFGGKVQKIDGARSGIKISAPKKMSGKKKYEWLADNKNLYRPYPVVEARYDLMVNHFGQPWMHPDGSYFYQYVEGSKREY